MGMALIVICLFVAQEQSGQIAFYSPVDHVTVKLNADGVANVLRRSSAQMFLLEEASFLASEGIQQDLELAGSQSQEIKSLIKRHRKDVFEFQKKIRSNNQDIAPDLKEKFLAARSQYRKDLENILLLHQEKRLAEIRLQLKLRQIGLTNFCRELEAVGEFQLSNHEIGNIAKIEAEWIDRIKTKSESTSKEIVDGILEILSMEQRESISETYGEQILPNVSLELFAAQLSATVHELNSNEEKDGELNRDEDIFSLVARSPQFELQNDLTWKEKPSQRSGAGSRADYMRVLVDGQSRQPGDIELLDYQASEIDSRLFDAKQKRSAVNQKVAEEIEAGDGRLSQRTKDELRQANNQYDNTLELAYDEVLLDFQREIVESNLKKLIAHRFGIFRMLLLGELGKERDVSNAQKKLLRELLESQHANLAKVIADIESEFHAELQNAMSEENKRCWTEAIGKPIDEVPASLVLLLR